MTSLEKRINLRDSWAALFPGAAVPADSQFALWLLLHDDSTVNGGMVQLAAKYRKLEGRMDEAYMVKFASAVMNRLQREVGAVKA
jgi:hypothetical protein